jgi:hypothetical protein
MEEPEEILMRFLTQYFPYIAEAGGVILRKDHDEYSIISQTHRDQDFKFRKKLILTYSHPGLYKDSMNAPLVVTIIIALFLLIRLVRYY